MGFVTHSWKIDLDENEFVTFPRQMPNAPKRPCPTGGCPNFQPCAKHPKPANRDSKTPDERKFYSSYAWQKVRNTHIEAEPLCRECAKHRRYVPAVVVDHVVAIRDGGSRLDRDNLQSLCWSCHQAKRQREYQARVDR